MGKGSSAPTETTVEQTSLPDYAEPYFTRLLQRAEGQSLTGYTPYGGARIAGRSGDILGAQQLTREIAGSGIAGLPQAMGVASGNIAQGQQIAGQAQPYDFGRTRQFTDPGEAESYMSPYIRNVLDVQKEQARRQFNEQGGARAAQAVKAGAFGGSRQAVQEGLAERDLLNRMANIEASGMQQAYQQAQQGFQADRAAQFGTQQAQAQQDMAARAQQLQALGFSAEQAAQMAGFGEMGRAADIQNAQLLEAVGQQDEAFRQRQLDIGYEDFLRQQAYPEQQLQLYSSILRGVPVEPTVTQIGYQPYNPLQQALGAGLGAIGLYRGLSA
jgi:hypothetical protein